MPDFTDLKREALARHLRRHIAGEVRFDATSRQLYSTDASIYQIDPLGVIIPRTVDDLIATVQITAEAGIALVPRGGGTSLSGQSIGPGVVIDCSKYLNRILDVDPAGRRARVQPGVVLDRLNRHVASDGLQFGPDVATSSRANLGGMIGNNSAGARSIVYGKTLDHVRSLRLILADGSVADASAVSAEEWESKARGHTPEALIYRQVRQVVGRHATAIAQRFPGLLRRVSGYNLDVVADVLAGPQRQGEGQARKAGLHSLICGSEGTLAVITEAELKLVPRPGFRGLVIPHFATLRAALDSLPLCLEAGPSAVELMDQMLLDLAAQHRVLKRVMRVIQGRPAAIFMVEFSGDDTGAVAAPLERLASRLRAWPGVDAVTTVLEPSNREPLWGLRRAALPLLLGLPGDQKPVTFVEDTAVPPERLSEFVAQFQQILKRHNTHGAFYGHASVGCLHIRPVLNLKDPADVARMRRIAEEVTDLVLAFGGALSGEHGDGLARSEWNRKMFGDEVYQALREIKAAFDPEQRFNPGKIVDSPAMTENLRFQASKEPAQEVATLFDYSRQGGFKRAVELCNGSGVCRRLEVGAMCPSFRATLDERDSTRARANILRRALEDERALARLRSRDVHGVLDLCLMCKACKTECPSGVDMAKLKAEYLQIYYRNRSRPVGDLLLASVPHASRLASRAAPLANWLQRSRLVRWLLEKTAGIDRRRTLPRYRVQHFRRWFSHHTPAPSAGRRGRVMLLDDCFTTYQEPAIGRSAVRVLEHAGYTVDLADLVCCGRPLISRGYLKEARALVREQAALLAQRLQAGMPLLGLEPSCLSALADDWPELAPGPDTGRIAASAHLTDAWLADRAASSLTFEGLGRSEKVLLHTHCHQQALWGKEASAAALHLVPGLDVQILDSGCCGMAGAFGLERAHYDISVRIANLALLPALAAAPDATVVATGTSCRHQIRDLAGRPALHPLEVLSARLRKGEGSRQS